MVVNKRNFLIIAVITLVLYIRITGGFFLQDEWFSYGWFILHRNLNFVDSLKFFFYPSLGHFNPFTLILESLLFSWWNLKYQNFLLLGVFLHILVLVPAYLVAVNIFKGNKLLPFLVTLLFAVMAGQYQAVAWPVINLAILLSAFFGLWSFYFFLRSRESVNSKYLACSLVLLLVSLFFKEITIGLFPLMFLLIVFDKKQIKKNLALVFGFGIFYIFVKATALFVPRMNDAIVTDSLPFSKLIYNFLTAPFRFLTYTLMPSDVVKSISFFIAGFFPAKITGGVGSPQFEVFVVKRVMEVFSLGTGFILTAVCLFTLRKKNNFRLPLFLGLAWVFVNSFIFSFSPGKSSIAFVPDSRNLYFVGIGSAIFVVSLAAVLFKDKRKFVFLMLGVILFNAYFLNKSLISFTQVGQVRRQIVEKIYKEHQTLPAKVIFLTESDSSFYGLPESESILPFQSGFGQVLLAYYAKTQGYSPSFFKDGFLWNITDEGYQEIDNQGFGYFRRFNDLAKFIGDNKINAEVISYRFSSVDNSVEDISSEVNGRIESYLSQKKLINSKNFLITASQNNEDIKKAYDNNTNTIWSSKLPYNNYQYLIVDMKRNYSIAEIDINSYNNQDQNNVGYKVSLSQNGQDWQNVFEAKKYPPDPTFENKLYFKPATARYVKLEQIGSHKFAPWVISEMTFYETYK